MRSAKASQITANFSPIWSACGFITSDRKGSGMPHACFTGCAWLCWVLKWWRNLLHQLFASWRRNMQLGIAWAWQLWWIQPCFGSMASEGAWKNCLSSGHACMSILGMRFLTFSCSLGTARARNSRSDLPRRFNACEQLEPDVVGRWAVGQVCFFSLNVFHLHLCHPCVSEVLLVYLQTYIYI